jgi:hypothetical protein
MSQCRCRIDDSEPFTLLIDLDDSLYDIIDAALSVDTTWNSQADQLPRRMRANPETNSYSRVSSAAGGATQFADRAASSRTTDSTVRFDLAAIPGGSGASIAAEDPG